MVKTYSLWFCSFVHESILFGDNKGCTLFVRRLCAGAFYYPLAHTEVVDPIALGARIVEPQENCCCCGCDTDVNSVPECICSIFEENLVGGEDVRKVLVTLGLFTIVRLEREVQLIIPVIDFCIPNDECSAVSSENNPCELFDRLCFPIDEFFPPEKGCLNENNSRCL